MKIAAKNATHCYKSVEEDYNKIRKNNVAINARNKILTDNLIDEKKVTKELKEKIARLGFEHSAANKSWKIDKEKSDATILLQHQRNTEKLQLELKEKEVELKYLSEKVDKLEKFVAELIKEKNDLSKTFTNLATLPPLFKTILSQINFEAP